MNKPVSLVLAAVVAAMATPAWCAATAAPVLDKLVACADLRDTRQRLDCFDREVAPFRSAKAAPAAAASVAATPVAAAAQAPAATTPKAAPTAAAAATAPAAAPTTAASRAPTLGEEQLSVKNKPQDRDEPAAVQARIVSMREVDAGRFSVTLDNGQVWRHENVQLGSYLRQGDAITIMKGKMGTYRLTRDAGDEKNWIKVSRTK